MYYFSHMILAESAYSDYVQCSGIVGSRYGGFSVGGEI